MLGKCEDCIYTYIGGFLVPSLYCGKFEKQISFDEEGCKHFTSSSLDLRDWRLDYSLEWSGYDCCADCSYMDIDDENQEGHFYCKKYFAYYPGGKKACSDFIFGWGLRGLNGKNLIENSGKESQDIIHVKGGRYIEFERLYREAVKENDKLAQCRLGDAFFYGDSDLGVERDYGQALKWYRKAGGYSDAQNSIGWMYQNGLGVEQDYSEAVKWYRKAANDGNANAQNNLGWMYQNGLGVERDYHEAVKWYKKAAEHGDSNAQYNLGYMYQNGLGVNRDYHGAIKWYKKAAERGNSNAQNALVYVQNMLGDMYFDGKGVSQDYSEAAKYYSDSAEKGNSYGQYRLAVMYENGYGVKQNLNQAMYMYERAVHNGYADALEPLNKIRKIENHNAYLIFVIGIVLVILIALYANLVIPNVPPKFRGVSIISFFVILGLISRRLLKWKKGE